MVDQKRYEYKVFLELTEAGSKGEIDLDRMCLVKFRDALKASFGERFKWLKHGSMYKDYVAMIANIEGIGEDEKLMGKDAKIVSNVILDNLSHLGWKHMEYNIQPNRKDGNLWFSFRKSVVLSENNRI